MGEKHKHGLHSYILASWLPARAGEWGLHLLNFTRVLLVCFCTLSMSLWVAVLPFSMLKYCLAIFIIWILLKTPSGIDCSTDPWEMQLLTAGQLELVLFDHSPLSSVVQPVIYLWHSTHLNLIFHLTVRIKQQTVGGCGAYDVSGSVKDAMSSWETAW